MIGGTLLEVYFPVVVGHDGGLLASLDHDRNVDGLSVDILNLLFLSVGLWLSTACDRRHAP